MTPSTRIITCQRCNGAGHYYQGRTVVRCEDCGGSGQLLEEFESHAREAGGHCAQVLLALVGGAVGVVAGTFIQFVS